MDANFLREYQELKRRVAELEAREYMGKVTFADSANLTPFSRLRVAGTGKRSDIDFWLDKQPLLFDDISAGTGTATHQANARDILLAVGGTGSTAVGGMRHHYPIPYTAGDGQLIFDTGVADFAAVGGGTMYTFLRTRVSGSVVTTTYQQSTEWNTNKVPDRDWTKSQIFGIDFQSLRVGRVRYYMDIGGEAVLVHDIDNDNLRNTGYWQYPTLPPYAKLYNTETSTIFEIGYGDEYNGIGFMYDYGSLQSTATATYICESVMSEGGVDLFDIPGLPWVKYNEPGVTPSETVSVTSTTVYQPILSIRPNATHNSLENRALYMPQVFEITTDNPLFYKIIYRPTLTGASWSTADAYSSLQKDFSATAYSGGYEVGAGSFSTGRNIVSTENTILGRIVLALGYTGTADILSIVAVKTSATNASATAVWAGKVIR